MFGLCNRLSVLTVSMLACLPACLLACQCMVHSRCGHPSSACLQAGGQGQVLWGRSLNVMRACMSAKVHAKQRLLNVADASIEAGTVNSYIGLYLCVAGAVPQASNEGASPILMSRSGSKTLSPRISIQPFGTPGQRHFVGSFGPSSPIPEAMSRAFGNHH